MQTLKKLASGISSVPVDIAWNLAFIAEAKGNQTLGAQRPRQIIKTLKDQAVIESSLASNRLDGIKIDKKRANAVLFGASQPKDKREEVVKGYRLSLEIIHDFTKSLGFSQATIKKLHKMVGGNGAYKLKDDHGKTPGKSKTVAASKIRSTMKGLISSRQKLIKEKRVHPVIIAVASYLDFLCISPFSEANERLARLLLLLQLSQEGYVVGKYISIESLIEKNKKGYSKALESSRRNWLTGKHDPWPFISFILETLNKAYTEFIKYNRKEKNAKPKRGMNKGQKTELVLSAIKKLKTDFTLSQLQAKCPHVNTEMIRKVLDTLQREGNITLIGKDSGVRWMKKGKMLI